MRLYYNNLKVMCDVLQQAGWTDIEPTYKRELCEIDYEFDIDVSRKDVEEYFGDRVSEELFDFIDLDMLEGDDNFIEFMIEKYEDKAQAEADDSYS